MIRRYGLYIALLAAIIATCGSLTFSEVLHWTPCKLCWFQRIFMYPQVILLGIAVFRRDFSIKVYTITLSCIGSLFSIYHIILQNFPSLEKITACQTNVPCTHDPMHLFGFVTIPMLALTAFIIIIIFSSLAKPDFKEEETNEVQ